MGARGLGAGASLDLGFQILDWPSLLPSVLPQPLASSPLSSTRPACRLKTLHKPALQVSLFPV
jgi:hypothetical protein